MNRRSTAKKIAILLILAILLPYTQIEGQQRDVIEESIAGDMEWNIKCMNAENAYTESLHYKKIKVALLDSGVDLDEDIDCAKRMNFLDDREEDTNFMMDDVSGHGTSIAGLICAKKNEDRICGIAANVELYSAKVFEHDNEAPVERIVEAIRWAIDEKVNIIHMSFGTDEYSPELREAVREAYSQGILIIAATGNGGTAGEDETTVQYPAVFDEVLSVGATDIENKKAAWSASGEELDVVAPGDKILTTGVFGGIYVGEGTSMAAAQVTGMAAVLWGKYPDESNEFIRALITNSANEAVNRNGNTSEQNQCGEGMVDYAQSSANYSKMRRVYAGMKTMGLSDKKAIVAAGESICGMEHKITVPANINYVNGSWHKDVHQGFVTKAVKDKGAKNLSSSISLLKIAAIAPDKVSALKTLSKHPCFHGGANYMANTEYLYYLSQKYNEKSKSLPEYEKVFGEKASVYSGVEKKKDIRKELSKSTLKSLFDYCKKSKKQKKALSNKEKRIVLLGVAIHNGTDVFSHRAYKKFMYKTTKLEGDTGTSYSKELWAAIVHPSKSVVNPQAKKKAVPVVWEKLRDKRKNDGKKDQDQLNRVVNYTLLLKQLAIADKTDTKDGIKMPSSFQKYAQQFTNTLIEDWKSGPANNKVKKALEGFRLVAKKAQKKENLKIGVEYYTKYWKAVVNAGDSDSSKTWKISREPPKVELPKVEKGNMTFDGEKLVKIVFQKKGDTIYIAYEPGKKIKLMSHNDKNKSSTKAENNKEEFEFLKGLNKGEVVLVGYNGLQYKTMMIKYKRKITYSKKGLPKGVKKIKGVKKKELTELQFIDTSTKVKKKMFEKKGSKFKGYSKKKKGGKVIKAGDVISWSDKDITLYPIFEKVGKGKKKKKAKKG